MLDLEDKEACEQNLAEFLIRAWPIIDPGTPLVWGYPLEAICDHLQAVDEGHIRRLLITVFPGSTKSTATDVAYTAWAWLRRPFLRFISASYSEKLTYRDNDRCRRIIASDWYQRRWGDRYQLVAPNRPDKFENDQTGWALATSVGGQLLGHRADVIKLDDPNSPKVESEQVRKTTNRWFNEVVPTRLNNPETSAIILIQQRMHLEDCAGTALGQDNTEWVHLNIPMEYEPRPYVNGWGEDGKIHTYFDIEAEEVGDAAVFYRDWRTEPGELAWPERFSRRVVDDLKGVLGPAMAAAQLQQRPIPRGGAIIKQDWWQPWPEEPFPPLEFLLASVDTAYTEDTRNDPSAMTYWGVNHDEFGNPRIFLLWAWQDWLELHDLVTRIIDTCQIDKREVKDDKGMPLPRFPVHKVLIEAKASGISVAQEIARLLNVRATFGVDLLPATKDKTARLTSVEHVWASGIIYSHDRKWADAVIQQCASVPYTTNDHLADSAAQAIRWLRDCGYAPEKELVAEQYAADRAYKPKPKPLYPA